MFSLNKFTPRSRIERGERTQESNKREGREKKDGAAKRNKEMKRVGKRQKGDEEENGEGSERGRVGRWRGMREGARVSSWQQLKSYSKWFTFASLHKSAKQYYTKEITSGLLYIQTSDDR